MNGKERSSNSHRWPIILGIVGLLVALAVGSWFLIGPKFWTDERTVHVPNHDAQLRQVLWNVPQSLGPQFESDLQEYEPSLSPDGGEFYFVRGKPGRGAHIYASYRKNNQ